MPDMKQKNEKKSEIKLISKSNFADKWATENQVLGRPAKTNIRTPREILSINQNEGGGFHDAVWQLRNTAEEVANITLEIIDLNLLLKAKARAIPQDVNLEAPEWKDIKNNLSSLERKQEDRCNQLAKEMGVYPTDETKLLKLIWLPKGRKTAIRAARCLLKEHLLFFLSSSAKLLVYFCCTSPDGRNSKQAEELEKAQVDEIAAK